MKIFLSWSGDISKEIAHILEYSFTNIIQSLEIFCSDKDIAKGEFWPERLLNELNECDYGIICLTSENINSRWLNFEAGMMCRKFNKDISVINFNIDEDEIKQPLSFFQATKLEKDDIYKLISKINEMLEKPLKDDKLRDAFEKEWEGIKGREDDNSMKTQIESINTSFYVKSEEKLENIDSESIEEIKKLLKEQNIILDSKLNRLNIDNLEFEFRKESGKIFISTNGIKREIQSETSFY